MKQNGTAIPTNGVKKSTRTPLVWKEEANTGLDTIRKIILGKHIQEMEAKLQKVSKKYELLFQQMETKLSKIESEHELRLLGLESEFQERIGQLQLLIKQEIISVEKHVKAHSEKTTDFGKVLMELGKEWSLGKATD